MFQGIDGKGFDARHEICDRMQVSIDFSCRHEINAHAIGVESRFSEHELHGIHVPLGGVIAGFEVAFTLVTGKDANAISPVTQGLHDIASIDPSRAFYPDKINFGGILVPGDAD